MICDRCPRSSTPPLSPFLALAFSSSSPSWTPHRSLPPFRSPPLVSVKLIMLSFSLPFSTSSIFPAPSYFHAPCISFPAALRPQRRFPTSLPSRSRKIIPRDARAARDILGRTGYTREIASAASCKGIFRCFGYFCRRS